VQWLISDHLGTPRLILDQTGSLNTLKRHDYLPFGEEIPAGGRTTAMGYAAGDGVRQQFTAKERDVETGLDYFGARYFASTQGRFTGLDPENAGAALWHPQSWNGYTYVLNNPLRFIDPNGLRWAEITVDGGIAYRWFDDIEKDDNGQTEYDRALAAGYSAVTFDESKRFSFTNGKFAPGEILTTVTLDPRGPGSSTVSQVQVSFCTVAISYSSHDHHGLRRSTSKRDCCGACV
jgi:RHS repeat-associated protein